MNTPPIGVQQAYQTPINRQALAHFTQNASFTSQGGITLAFHGLVGEHTFRVGRSDRNGVSWENGPLIKTSHQGVSAQHLEIIYDSSSRRLIINDLLSSNGTYYQGQKVGHLEISIRDLSEVVLSLGAPPQGASLKLVFSSAHAQATQLAPIQRSAYVMAPPPAVLPMSASKSSPYQDNRKLLRDFCDVTNPRHAILFTPDLLIQGNLKKWDVVLDAQGRIVQIRGRHKFHGSDRLPQPGDISIPLVVTPDNALVWHGDSSSMNQPQQEALRSWHQDTEKLIQQHQARYPLALELAFGIHPELGRRGHFGQVAFSLFKMIQDVRFSGLSQNVIVRLCRNMMGNIEAWLPNHGDTSRPEGDFVGEVMLNLDPMPRSDHFNREVSIRCGYANQSGLTQDEQRKFAEIIQHIQHWFQPYISKRPAQAPEIPSLLPSPSQPSSGILGLFFGRKNTSVPPPVATIDPRAQRTQAMSGTELGQMMQGGAKPAHWTPESPAHWKKDSRGILYYQIPLKQAHIVIGREGDETIHGDERVSRRHLIIERMDGDDFAVVALNHVTINGEVISEGQKNWIRRGDIVALTSDVSFIFDPVPPSAH